MFKDNQKNSFKEYLLEAVSTKNLNKVSAKIVSYISKVSGEKWFAYPKIEQYKNSDDAGHGLRLFSDSGRSIRFNFVSKNTSSNLKSVDMWNGTSRDPNFHLDIPKQVSLAKVLPSLVPIILKPKRGSFEVYPSKEETLKESEKFLPDFLLEASDEKLNRYMSAFDDVMGYIQTGKEFTDLYFDKEHQTNPHRYIRKVLITNYNEQFKKEGRSWVFDGSKTKLISEKGKIVSLAGGFFVDVTSGPKDEEYISDEPEEMEERVPFKEQMADLSRTVKLVLKGATNSLIISGKGGVGKCLYSSCGFHVYED